MSKVYNFLSHSYFQIFPQYNEGGVTSVSTFITNITDIVDYYWTSGNVKQVAMNVEVAGNPVEDLVGKNNP